MPRADLLPTWCSTALAGVIDGPILTATVVAGGDRAAYLVADGDDPVATVVALVAPGSVRLPVAMQVPVLPPLRAGTRALLGGGCVRVGTVGWRPARWWDPRPRLDAAALAGSAYRLLPVLATRPQDAFGVPLVVARDAIESLAHGDTAPAIALLGRGPGFTPAGDDVVAGALAALELAGARDAGAVARVLAAAADRTTTLSAALLRSAAAGQVVPQAARLLQAAAAGSDTDVTLAATGLFAVGSTSGSALALGVIAALNGVRTPEMETT